jgi:hypothetical protein
LFKVSIFLFIENSIRKGDLPVSASVCEKKFIFPADEERGATLDEVFFAIREMVSSGAGFALRLSAKGKIKFEEKFDDTEQEAPNLDEILQVVKREISFADDQGHILVLEIF